jgi:pantothenate synthetase
MPSEQAVRDALIDLRADAETTGRHPSVLALAARVGLPNTTFRRRYPSICAELAHAPRRAVASANATATAYEKLAHASLRQDHNALAEHLELAIANIQRLTLDNHELRQALEATLSVTRLPDPPARRAR